MQVAAIEELLKGSFPGAQITVLSDDGVHFSATIITDVFSTKSLVERQRMVYAVVGAHITNGDIHALTLKTFTQQEWQLECAN